MEEEQEEEQKVRNFEDYEVRYQKTLIIFFEEYSFSNDNTIFYFENTHHTKYALIYFYSLNSVNEPISVGINPVN